MKQFSDVYKNRHVLITGHTGFKGSWLTLWLQELGAKVTGLSLPPVGTPNHWDLLNLNISDYDVDIRDFKSVLKVIKQGKPEIIFHLAAQPLVCHSYNNPLDTWSTNVMGTVNLLEACRQIDSVSAIIVITTDKVYANQEWLWGYRENDPLGGHDPYSASKAACEIVADSYRKAFFTNSHGTLLATARAGNTMGGGDWSDDRLIPDFIRSVHSLKPLLIRSPHATRPWQHVLDCLSGYLLLGQKLLEKDNSCAEAWNFGPHWTDNCRVIDILEMMKNYYPSLEWELSSDSHEHESHELFLDSSKSRVKLGWKPVWDIKKCISATSLWYSQYYSTGKVESQKQLHDYFESAKLVGCSWIGE
jgi:CDP-glucose 4,6-dehydratase